MAKKGTSPWLYIGCGCATLAGLAVVAVVAAGFFGASLFKGYVEDMQDPHARTERAKEILGTEHLPDGYHARMYFSIPWVLDMVLLSDGPAADEGVLDEDFEPFDSAGLGEHLFVFFSVRGDADEDLDEVFERGRQSGGVKFDMGSHFRSFEELSRGELDLEPQQLSYVAHRGELETEDGKRIAGIYTQIRVGCPDRGRARLAIWFQRQPEGVAEDAPPDLPGTPADEATLRDFIGHFKLCAK